jgi:hypothetical protein
MQLNTLSLWSRRWFRILVLCGVVFPTLYFASMNRDWFYFYRQREQVVRDVAGLNRSILAVGLPAQLLGETGDATTRWPVWWLQAGAQGGMAQKTLCVIAGVHGNEPAGVQAVLGLALDLARNADKLTTSPLPGASSVRFALLPLANSWGWARDLRHNADNRDIARQFDQASTAETELIKTFVHGQRCTVLLDLHEDRYNDGFYALAYAPDDIARIEAMMARVAHTTGVPLATKPARGVWHVKQTDFATQERPTASLWARQNGVSDSLIVETSTHLPMQKRVEILRAVISAIAASM